MPADLKYKAFQPEVTEVGGDEIVPTVAVEMAEVD